jgi:hypothetical protein
MQLLFCNVVLHPLSASSFLLAWVYLYQLEMPQDFHLSDVSREKNRCDHEKAITTLGREESHLAWGRKSLSF